MENLKWLNESKTTITCMIDGRSASIPVCPGNSHYDQIIAEGLEVAEPDET